jgi:hypothetical protein
MVVKLNFTDGSSVIKNYNNSELYELGLLDSVAKFLEDKFGLEIESWDFADGPEGSDIYQFDIRNYFKSTDGFDGMEIDNKEVKSFEFPSEDSYEYNINLLGLEKIKNLYTKYVELVLVEESYDSYYDGGDPYNDDGPMDFEY